MSIEASLSSETPQLPVNSEQSQELPNVPETSEVLADVLPSEESLVTAKENNRTKKWAYRGALGAFAVGSAIALIQNPISELKDDVLEKAPYAVVGLAVSETMWVAGAAMMLGGAGANFRKTNPFKIHKDFQNNVSSFGEASNGTLRSEYFKKGLTINTIGAIGTAATVAVGAFAALPRETWPGAVGLAALDVAATIGVRSPIKQAVRAAERQAAIGETADSKVTVRHARLSDIDELADIDLALFSKAYGDNLPSKASVIDMLRARRKNATYMFIAERNGAVEGFVSAFRTDKSAEAFQSWEESTNNGTLEGKVVSDGKYLYVANMTIKHESVVEGAKDMLLARLFAETMKADGIEYGYFESRMPHFNRWLTKTGQMTDDPSELDRLAKAYAAKTLKDGRRYDPQLRMYESDGFELGQPVANAFDDSASMNYGVVCKAWVPMRGKITSLRPIKWTAGVALAQIAKYPKLLNKVI